jgi:hypothetical protein
MIADPTTIMIQYYMHTRQHIPIRNPGCLVLVRILLHEPPTRYGGIFWHRRRHSGRSRPLRAARACGSSRGGTFSGALQLRDGLGAVDPVGEDVHRLCQVYHTAKIPVRLRPERESKREMWDARCARVWNDCPQILHDRWPMPSFLSILHETDFSWLQNMQENCVSGHYGHSGFLLEALAYVPSGPRLFDADGGGFRDDFFRLPMGAESGGVQEFLETR